MWRCRWNRASATSGYEHFLFTGDEVTGLVDFGAADLDSPAGGRRLDSSGASSATIRDALAAAIGCVSSHTRR